MLESYPDVLTVDDVREILNIGRSKAYGLINTGQIKAMKIGRSIRIPKPMLLEFMSTPSYNNGEVDRRRYCEGGSNESNG